MKIRKITNSIIPPKGFKAITIWPFVFVREDCAGRFTERDMRHEAIHARQQVEMLVILFYLWYGIEWMIRLCLYRDRNTAYRNISFEQEAYMNETNKEYLSDRRCFAWVKYLTKKTYRK